MSCSSCTLDTSPLLHPFPVSVPSVQTHHHLYVCNACVCARVCAAVLLAHLSPSPQSLVGPDVCASCLLFLVVVDVVSQREKEKKQEKITSRFIFTQFVLYFYSETC